MSGRINTFEQVHGELAFRIGCLVQYMEHIGHPIKVIETVRTQERQDELYAQGRTKPGRIVTWTTTSKHTPKGDPPQGRAVDVCFTGPQPFSEHHPWALLGRIGVSYGLRWGGDWDGDGVTERGETDFGHFELP